MPNQIQGILQNFGTLELIETIFTFACDTKSHILGSKRKFALYFLCLFIDYIHVNIFDTKIEIGTEYTENHSMRRGRLCAP